MNSSTITVHWHDENQPVYSVDFQPLHGNKIEASPRLATGGGDNNVRIWKLNKKDGEASIEYLSTLRKHTQAVNVVRFDPRGDILATAGDDGTLILWTLSDHIVKEFGVEDDEELKESWVVKQIFRNSTSEIYDLSWSPDSKHIATGSMDNITRIYNVTTGQQVYQLAEHNHYVQGVTWDPRNDFLATQSADRSVHVYSLKHRNNFDLAPTLYYKFVKGGFPVSRVSSDNNIDTITAEESTNGIKATDGKEPSTISHPDSMDPPNNNRIALVTNSPKSLRRSVSVESLPAVKPLVKKKTITLYHSETLQSFFRRLTFSPDGSLLLTPSGIYRTSSDVNADPINDDEVTSNEHLTNTVYFYIRSGLNKSPVCHTPGLKKPAIVIKFSPIIYRLSPNKTPLFKLPYKMVFAVATQDSIIVHDTESTEPLGMVSNLHYSTITDLAWDKDGQTIIISSADGFCSQITFDDNIFGEILHNSQHTKNFWTLENIDHKIDPTQAKAKTQNETGKESHLQPVQEKEKSRSPKHATIDQFIGKPVSKFVAEPISLDSPETLQDSNEITSIANATEDIGTSIISVDSQSSDSAEKEDQKKKKRRIIPTLITK